MTTEVEDEARSETASPSSFRRCYVCRAEKPIREFYRDKTQPGGYGYRCRPCSKTLDQRRVRASKAQPKTIERLALRAEGKRRCTRCRVVKVFAEFLASKNTADGCNSWCRPCWNEYQKLVMRERAPAQKEARRQAALLRPPRPPPRDPNERAKEWRDQNKERFREICRNSYKKLYATEGGRMRIRLQAHKRRALERSFDDGTLTPDNWRRVLAAFDHRCCYCEGVGVLTVDHLEPISRGGANSIRNVVPACTHCNFTKNASPFEKACRRLGVDVEIVAGRILRAHETLGLVESVIETA